MITLRVLKTKIFTRIVFIDVRNLMLFSVFVQLQKISESVSMKIDAAINRLNLHTIKNSKQHYFFQSTRTNRAINIWQTQSVLLWTFDNCYLFSFFTSLSWNLQSQADWWVTQLWSNQGNQKKLCCAHLALIIH